VVEVAAAAVLVATVAEVVAEVVEAVEAAADLIFEVWPTFRATLYEDDKGYKS
jgi:hypothetical protein